MPRMKKRFASEQLISILCEIEVRISARDLTVGMLSLMLPFILGVRSLAAWNYLN